MKKIIIVLLTVIMQGAVMAKTIDVYFGTYTRKSSAEGIYHAELDLASGRLYNLKLAVKSSNPSFIEIHPTGKFLYAVAEGKAGQVKAFSINPKTKKLKLLNQRSSTGAAPCHISLDKNGKNLLVANYSSGNVAVFPIQSDGSLGEVSSTMQHHGSGITRRQKGPRAHSINLSPDNRFAYVTDLGLDKIMIYKFDVKTGVLKANDPPFVKLKPGAGPRHLSFHPNGRFAYVINELDETITVFGYNTQTGALTEIQHISTLPSDFKGVSWCAEVRVHPNGKFLYGSNRGHDSIVTYRIDPVNGKLKLLGFQNKGIDNPRNFNIDASGKYCLVGNQDNDTVLLFKINQQTGLLEPTAHSLNIGKPICIRFLEN
jgi:6-phosphogluconolactonase